MAGIICDPITYNPLAEYFANNIQYVEVVEGVKIYEGLSYGEFLINWNKDIEKNVNELAKFLCINKRNKKEEKRLKELKEFQKNLSGIGIDLDFANLYFLCSFIIRVIKDGYFALLKPNPKETLAMIKNITKVAITNADGSVIETIYDDIIDPIKEALSNVVDADTTTYEVERLVKLDEVSNQEIFQAKFVCYLSRFLRDYFPEAKRRKNSYIVPMEQELVMYMLSYFGLGNIGISLDRYRQLFMYAKKIEERFGYSYIEDKLLPIGFVRYEKWKGKRLSFISKDKKPYKLKQYNPQIGDTMIFTKASVARLLRKK